MNLLLRLDGALLRRNPARRNGDRQGHHQKPRQMMRPDIDRVEMKRERVEYWVSKGAQCSERVDKLLKLPQPAAAASVA